MGHSSIFVQVNGIQYEKNVLFDLSMFLDHFSDDHMKHLYSMLSFTLFFLSVMIVALEHNQFSLACVRHETIVTMVK